MLLLEKEELPRYKPCGGGLTAKAVREILFDLSPVVEDVCHDFEISFRLGEPIRRRYHYPLVYTVDRARLDHYLAESAAKMGAILLDATPAEGIIVNGQGVEVNTGKGSFKADALVGADGVNGMVARGLGLGADFCYGIAWETRMAPGDETRRRWQGVIGLDLGTIRPSGYGWVFPKRDHLSVGVGVQGCNARQIKDYYVRFAGRYGLNAQAIEGGGQLLLHRPKGSPVQSGRALLAGGAAGLVDAFTGEGIYWAVRSGKLAAAAVLDLLGGRAQDLATYERRVEQELMPDLSSARRWLNVYRWAPALYYLLLRHSDRFWQAVCQVIRGEICYQEIDRALGPLRFLADLLPVDGGRKIGQRQRSMHP